MPRNSRESITSQYIHVIVQGIKKEYIFQKEQYKKYYLKLLWKTLKEYKETKILAFCIMDNHAHFLVYTEQIKQLSQIMSKINTTYGIFFNKSEDRVGYVFRNRYYTHEILDQKHLLKTFVYIHKNPIKANIVKKENEYKYSSYINYEKNIVDNDIVKLVFNSIDYMKIFYNIHENFSEEGIFDIKDSKENIVKNMDKIKNEFCKKYNVTLDDIKSDKYLLRLLILEFKKCCNITNTLIIEYLHIGKNRIYNIMKCKIC